MGDKGARKDKPEKGKRIFLFFSFFGFTCDDIGPDWRVNLDDFVHTRGERGKNEGERGKNEKKNSVCHPPSLDFFVSCS